MKVSVWMVPPTGSPFIATGSTGGVMVTPQPDAARSDVATRLLTRFENTCDSFCDPSLDCERRPDKSNRLAERLARDAVVRITKQARTACHGQRATGIGMRENARRPNERQ